MEVKDIAQKYKDYIIRLRREFHRFPELSYKEYETGERIIRELEDMGLPYKRVTETGIVAEIKGDKPGGMVALRTDMDALPVFEQTGLAYASENEGNMHACGHDAHMAMILGAARILCGMKDQICGTVRLIFQPTEETGVGSNGLISAGVLEGVESIFGMHVWSDLETGKISAECGPRMASTDFFTIEIEGKSCHGSMPHQGVDAIVVASDIVSEIQSIVSRYISPLEPAVLSIGEFHAGTAKNIMAGTAMLSGTARAFNPAVRQRLYELLNRVVNNVSKSFGAKAVINYDFCHGPIVNDAVCAGIAAKAVEKCLGTDGVGHFEKVMAGEDFSEYMARVPGVFLFVGVGNRHKKTDFPQHSCFYNIDEDALVGGAMVAAQYALDFLVHRRDKND